VANPAALPALPRTYALARGLTARSGLTVIVAASFLARLVASAAHPAPRYLPDEYLYTAIARSLGSGHAPTVRGTAAHFPALLEPLLAAPLQALFSPVTAYRLTQAENALFMSLAAVPVYLLARRLRLTARYSLGCAVFAVTIPDMVYASFTLSDPLSYPLVLGSVLLGVTALDRPSWPAQLGFLTFALLATLARAQNIVLLLAFVVAAVALDRRRVLRTQRLTLGLLLLPLCLAAASGPSRIVGSYSYVAHLHLGAGLVRWIAIDLFLLSLASGVVLVPGALAAILLPRGRGERAFAVLAGTFGAAVVFQAALFASNGLDRFQERYLFTLLPLVPIGFGLYVRHRSPARLPLCLAACGLVVAAVRVPVSSYSASLGKSDSPFLIAVFRLEQSLGTGNTALFVSLLAAAAALAAIVLSRPRRASAAFGAAVALLVLVSAGVANSDYENTRAIRAGLPSDLSWVDHAGVRNVTLVQTVGSPPQDAIEQLYWNRSIDSEALLGAAQPTDGYGSAPRIRIAGDGTLTGVGSTVLVQELGATVRFSNAQAVARAGSFSLWTADGEPRLSLLEQGRSSDGWLSRRGRLTIWPDASGRTHGVLGFDLSLPRSARPVTVLFGTRRYDVLPGLTTHVTYAVDVRGRWSIPFSARGGRLLQRLRIVSARSTEPLFRRAGRPAYIQSRSACASGSDSSFFSVLFSICRMRSRVTPNALPTSSSVHGWPPVSPKRSSIT
jgi:hypothetical protein